MGNDFPPELAVLLDGADPSTRERAWSAFLDRYHRLLLKAAGRFGGDYDARMDRYRFLVESLSADECRRLRAYQAQPRSSFPAWLTVVTRRLCVDFERSRTGRLRAGSDPDGARESHRARQRLAQLVGSDVSPDEIAESGRGAEERLVDDERHAAVESVLGALSAGDQLLLRLRFDDDLPVRRIAQVMGFPTVFHVYRRLNALLAQVRTQLETRGIRGTEP